MKKALFALGFLLFFIGCRNDIVEINTMPVCFDKDILPIFQSNCAMSGCHDGKSNDEANFDLSNYNGIMQGIVAKHPDRSRNYQVICLKSGESAMPPSPRAKLTSDQKNKIKAWIIQGALNTSNCNFGCDTSVVTYANQVKQIMNTNCTGCHNATSTAALLDLTKYSDVNSIVLDGRLMGSIQGKPGIIKMPPFGTSVGSCDISKLKKWIREGAKEF